MRIQEEERLRHEKPQSVHFVATHDKGKTKDAKVPHTSRKKTSCQLRNMTIRILVSSIRKMGIWRRIAKSIKDGSKRKVISYL
jgi:hypothetical protein